MVSAKRTLLYGLSIFLLLSCAYHPGKKFSKAIKPSNQCEVLAQKRASLASASRKAKRGKRKPTAIVRKAIPASTSAMASSATSTLIGSEWNVIVIPPMATEDHPVSSDAAEPIVIPQSEAIFRQSQQPLQNGIPKSKAVEGSSRTAFSAVRYTYALPVVLLSSALMGMTLVFLFQEKSKNLSRWAAVHPWKARTLIAGAQVFGGTAMVMAGHYLHADGFVVPDLVQYASLAGLSASTLLYPDVHSKMTWSQTTYLRQKFHDVSVFASGTALMLFLGNHYSVETRQDFSQARHITSLVDWVPGNSTIHVVKKQPALATADQDPPKTKGKGGKIVGTILASLGFTVLFALVAALACEVSCSGSGALAILIFLVGEGGLGFLYAAAIRAIWGMQRKRSMKAAAAVPN